MLRTNPQFSGCFLKSCTENLRYVLVSPNRDKHRKAFYRTTAGERGRQRGQSTLAQVQYRGPGLTKVGPPP